MEDEQLGSKVPKTESMLEILQSYQNKPRGKY